MNMINNFPLRKALILLSAVNCILFARSINAAEWQAGFESRFDYSPESSSTNYQNNFDDKQWSSGSSFNEENKIRYSPVVSKNPWKPVDFVRYEKTFASQRPWGNVPNRKPKNKNNMKFYDQRFKQWSHRQDSFYRNDAMLADPFIGYGQSSGPFSGAYSYPGSGYNGPLITPSIYPGSILNTGRYGPYPGGSYPYPGLLSGPRFW